MKTHTFDPAKGMTSCGIMGYIMNTGGWLRSDAQSYRLVLEDPTCLLCNGQGKTRGGANNPYGNRGRLKGVPNNRTWLTGPKIDVEKARALYAELHNWHQVAKYYPPFRFSSLRRAAALHHKSKWATLR